MTGLASRWPRLAALAQRARAWDRTKVLAGAAVLLVVGNFLASVVVPFAWWALVVAPPLRQEPQSIPCYSDDNDTMCPPVSPGSNRDHWDNLIDHYRLDMSLTVLGLFLLFMPMGWVATGEIYWSPWQPTIWLLAVASAPAVAYYGRGLPWWKTALFGALIALQASGFAAYHWSTVGD